MGKWINMTKRVNRVLLIMALGFFLIAPFLFIVSVQAQESEGTAPIEENEPAEENITNAESQAKITCWAFMGAAIATGIGSLGAGMAVGQMGSAAMGAVAEKPELMGKSLIYVALAEGIAIYGLLIAIIILSKI